MAPKANGADVTVKLAALVAVPSSVTTVMRPVLAPTGTVAVIVPELLTVNVVPVPLNLTSVAPMKFVPVIVTPVPAAPTEGAKELMAGVTVKRVVVFNGPLPGVVTVMGPVVAPDGTVVVIVPGGPSVNVAATPLNETAVAPVKPVIVTPVPTAPKVGENGLKLIPSRKAMMSSVAVGPSATVLIGPENAAPGEVLKKDEL